MIFNDFSEVCAYLEAHPKLTDFTIVRLKDGRCKLTENKPAPDYIFPMGGI